MVAPWIKRRRARLIKAQEEAAIKLPTMDELAEMDWADIHKMVGGNL